MNSQWRVLIGLAAGLIIGSIVAASRNPALVAAAAVIEPLGTLWVNAIRMTVIPLVVSLLVVGVAAGADARGIGRLGLKALALFLVFLVVSGVYAVLVTPPLMAGLRIDADVAESLRASAASSASASAETVKKLPTTLDWLLGLVPANPFRAAADGAILPLVVFTLAFALALTRVGIEAREPVLRVFRALADAMLVVVSWVLWAAPIGVFALALTLAARVGMGAAGAIVYYIVALSLALAIFALALYPVAVVVGRVPLRRFASALGPAQIVAATARASLAALPAMIAGAREKLKLPEHITSFVLPLAVSTFRLNVPIAWVVGVAFLGRLYGVDLGAAQFASLVVTSVLLSFSVPGIPSSSLFILAPVLVGLGLPAEGVGILIAVDTIPDVFKTTLNVTSHMTAAVVLAPPRASTDEDRGTKRSSSDAAAMNAAR
ncbi:MAG: dicarboxylate/amino acid:cation symporter [Gemmatimonadaceae bacterium]